MNSLFVSQLSGQWKSHKAREALLNSCENLVKKSQAPVLRPISRLIKLLERHKISQNLINQRRIKAISILLISTPKLQNKVPFKATISNQRLRQWRKIKMRRETKKVLSIHGLKMTPHHEITLKRQTNKRSGELQQLQQPFVTP